MLARFGGVNKASGHGGSPQYGSLTETTYCILSSSAGSSAISSDEVHPPRIILEATARIELVGANADVIDANDLGLLPANWPYTIFVIMPTNRRLMNTPTEAATAETRSTIRWWGVLHAGRSALGLVATLIFLSAQR